MMDEAEVSEIIRGAWQLQMTERAVLDRRYDYVQGRRGGPVIPDAAEPEVKEIAGLSVKNCLGMVRDVFAENLSVVGYRSSTALDNAPAWELWQRNRMDARQAEIPRATATYGVAYVVVTPTSKGPVFTPRSPRQIIALYADPNGDKWPAFALEIWTDTQAGKRFRQGIFYDEEFAYPVQLGDIPVGDLPGRSSPVSQPVRITEFGEPIRHGATDDGEPVCPVIRFLNGADADNPIEGEIEPLINLQRAINTTNFDRLIVSRFGAWPQKVISGWSGTKSEVLEASARRVWTFEDADVKAQALPAAALDGYNALLEEQMAHLAMVAQVSPTAIVGKIVNLSASAIAAAEGNQNRKLAYKKECLGESWEQVLRLGAAMAGDTDTAADEGAEVIWRETESRTFAEVVDGIVKLASQGVPVEEMLPLIPGLSPAMIAGIKSKMGAQKATVRMAAIRNAASAVVTNPAVEALANRNTPVPNGSQLPVPVPARPAPVPTPPAAPRAT